MAHVFWLCSTLGEDSHCSLMPSPSLRQLGADQGRIVPGGLWEIQRFLDEQSIWIKLFLPLFWDIRLHLGNGRCRAAIV